MRLPVRLQAQVVEEARRHQHRHVPPAQGHQRAGSAVPGGPEGVGDLRAGPQPRPPGLGSRRYGIDGAGGEEDVPGGRGLRAVVRVGAGAQRLRLPHRPLHHHALGVGVGNGVGLPVAHQDHLVEDLPLRVGEGPAAHPPIVGGQVAGRDREALPGNDEDQQAAIGQVAGRVRQEGVLRPLVLRVIVIRWVQEEQPEGPVRYGRGEQVRGQGVVEPLLRLLRPVPVQLDAVGLDGDGVGPVQAAGPAAPAPPPPRSRGRGCAACPGPGCRRRRGCEPAPRSGRRPWAAWGRTRLLPVQRVSCRFSFRVLSRVCAPRQAAIAKFSLRSVSNPTTSPTPTLRW